MVKTTVYLDEAGEQKLAQPGSPAHLIRETLAQLTDSSVSYLPHGLGMLASGECESKALRACATRSLEPWHL